LHIFLCIRRDATLWVSMVEVLFYTFVTLAVDGAE
jgi:hypothetical protein